MANDGISLDDVSSYDWAIAPTPTATAAATASTAAASTEARLMCFTLGTAKTGTPTNSTLGDVQVISFPTSDASVVCVFRVPPDLVTTQPMTLVVNAAAASAPGAVNNKFGLKMRYTVNNGAASSFTSDTFTLSNDTSWNKFTGTLDVIPASVLTSGDVVQVELYRDTAVATSAAVAVKVSLAALSYISIQ